VRVISGAARGRPLFLPPKSSARPTSDRIKEALFNILPPLAGKSFLDLFAGSGSVGIEALSRDAARVVFIEKDATLCDCIKTNLLRCGLAGNSEVRCAEVKKAIPVFNKTRQLFDIVFADPPYDIQLVAETLGCLAEGMLIVPQGRMILQHSKREEPDLHQAKGLVIVDQRKYGDTLLTFLKSH
jgi:16S rRNA (guanine(966)-N(2))-methyltransferase RsmD